MKPFVDAAVGHALGHLQQATTWFMQNAVGEAHADNAGAGKATDYMQAVPMGFVVLGYMWCSHRRKAALAKIAAPTRNGPGG